MKPVFALIILTIALIAGAFKTAEEKFNVDTRKSSLTWKARKVTGEHRGTIQLASGTLSFNSNSLVSGTFNIDMRSIAISDLKGESRQNLLNHLKSETFFAVADYPVSTFEIVKVSPSGEGQVNVSGNLTIKGITQPVSFQAAVKRQKNTITATAANIRVDRIKYNIKYRSKSFFGDLGDKAINDEFELSVNLVASML